MADIVKLFSGANLAPQNLSKYKDGILRIQASAPAVGGLPILRLDKEGVWRYGQDLQEIEPESLWAVNPLSFQKGYVCWRKGAIKPLGKQMRNIFSDEGLVDANDLPDLGGTWSESVLCDLACASGEDTGTVVQFVSNSMGGVERWHELVAALGEQFDADPTKLMPVVALEHDGYFHSDGSYGVRHPETKQPGWIVKPIFRIVEWRATDNASEAQVDTKTTGTAAAAANGAGKGDTAPRRRGAAAKTSEPAPPATPPRRARRAAT